MKTSERILVTATQLFNERGERNVTASDIAIEHKLRECLNQHRPERDELGVKVPVVAEVRHGDTVRYVRLGSQFCVKDVDAAIASLRTQAFEARSSDRLVLS